MSDGMEVEEALNESRQFIKFTRSFLKLEEVIRFVASAKQKQKEAEDLRNKAKGELESINRNIEKAKSVLAEKIKEIGDKVPATINAANKEIKSAIDPGKAEVRSLNEKIISLKNQFAEMESASKIRIESLQSEEKVLSNRVGMIKKELDSIRQKVGL